MKATRPSSATPRPRRLRRKRPASAKPRPSSVTPGPPRPVPEPITVEIPHIPTRPTTFSDPALCALCGTSRTTSTVALRWIAGHPVRLCLPCWRDVRRRGDDERLKGSLSRRRQQGAQVRGNATNADTDRDELARELGLDCEVHIRFEDGFLDRARRALDSFEHLALDLPPFRAMVANSRGTAFGRRQPVPEHEEDRRRLELEREQYERSLMRGFCIGERVPVEYVDWIYESAKRGAWISPIFPFAENGYRIEPHVGGYLDDTRLNSPPCLVWGRHTRDEERSNWIADLNEQLGRPAVRGRGPARQAFADPVQLSFRRAVGEIAKTTIPRRGQGPNFARIAIQVRRHMDLDARSGRIPRTPAVRTVQRWLHETEWGARLHLCWQMQSNENVLRSS